MDDSMEFYRVVDPDKLKAYLETHREYTKCPVCGAAPMIYTEYAAVMPLANVKGDFALSEYNMIFAPVSCSRCGLSLLINARSAELLKSALLDKWEVKTDDK